MVSVLTLSTEEREKALGRIIGQLMGNLRQCAFALETTAHLRGLERQLLPYADAARTVIAETEKALGLSVLPVDAHGPVVSVEVRS